MKTTLLAGVIVCSLTGSVIAFRSSMHPSSREHFPFGVLRTDDPQPNFMDFKSRSKWKWATGSQIELWPTSRDVYCSNCD